jgi:hypothetical protein
VGLKGCRVRVSGLGCHAAQLGHGASPTLWCGTTALHNRVTSSSAGRLLWLWPLQLAIGSLCPCSVVCCCMSRSMLVAGTP